MCGPRQISLATPTSTYTLTSPGFPDNYPNMDCHWHVAVVPASYRVYVQFLQFNTEACCDALSFQDDVSMTTTLEYRGKMEPLDIAWPGSELVIMFTTDEHFTRSGFKLMISATDETGK